MHGGSEIFNTTWTQVDVSMQLAVPPGNSTFREAMVMGSFLKIGQLSRGFDWPKLEVEHKK